MKKRKLKGFVLPTIYFIITVSIFVGVMLLGQNFIFEPSDYDYGVETLKEDDKPSESVINEEENINSDIISPVTNNANLSIHFYDKDDSTEVQQNSLIYYANTYIPNTGTLYTSDTDFEVKNVFQGKVIEILDDEFFGQCIVIEHNNNLRTYYYGLKDIEVAVGDELSTGAILGMANNNTILNNQKTFLIEVYYNNELLNPEKFIGTKITNYN